MTDDKAVHLSNYSEHNSLQIACDKSWTTAKWGPTSGRTATKGVYESDDDRLYTFEDAKVTCDACKKHRGGK